MINLLWLSYVVTCSQWWTDVKHTVKPELKSACYWKSLTCCPQMGICLFLTMHACFATHRMLHMAAQDQFLYSFSTKSPAWLLLLVGCHSSKPVHHPYMAKIGKLTTFPRVKQSALLKHVCGVYFAEDQLLELYQSLEKVPHVHAYLKDELPNSYHYHNNRRILDIIVEADEGYLVCKNRPSCAAQSKNSKYELDL